MLYVLWAALVELGLVLVTIVVLLLLGVDQIYFISPILLGFFPLVVLDLAALGYRRCKQSIRSMRAGEDWARQRHWTYSEQEWQMYTDGTWRRLIRGSLLVVGHVAARPGRGGPPTYTLPIPSSRIAP